MTWARWLLLVEAKLLRGVAYLAATLSGWIAEKRTRPSFIRRFTTTRSPRGQLSLHFYTSEQYLQEKGKVSRPTIVDFHGGGFCFGTPDDDFLWCNRLVQDLDAIVVSVDYRLAPEYPFPTAVEDGVEALQYLIANAAELGIDTNRIATSGFSAGGNMSITVPLMFHEEQNVLKDQVKSIQVKIKAAVAWYPSTDFTRSRQARVAAMVRPDKQLPRFLTTLFDKSYLPNGSSLTSPYLSPFIASGEMLEKNMPDNFILYTCEWDMLEKEGTDFGNRLAGELGKNVRSERIIGARHGWDKFPGASPAPDDFYKAACVSLRRAFEGESL